MYNEILLVAPYHDLEVLALKFNKQHGMKVSVIEGNMNQSIEEINYAVNNGVRIILSRWGTSRYLRSKINIPVVDICASPMDLIKPVLEVINKGFKRIAVVNVSAISIGKNERQYLSKIPGISLHYTICSGVTDIKNKVRHLIENEDVDSIVGDVTAVNEAKKMGVNAELVESGVESFVNALTTCKSMLYYDFMNKYKNEQIKVIANLEKKGIVLTDNNDKLLFYNSQAQKLLECSEVNNDESQLYNIINTNLNKKIPVNVDNIKQGNVILLNLKNNSAANEEEFTAKYKFSDIIGQEELKNRAKKFASSNATVIIYGETGTGKELFAQSIHNDSKRSDKPFISVNCASLSGTLIESELFGYEDCAFTGAAKGGKKGLFELANEGTLFLDEIGEIPLEFQAKLLRVLQEKEIRKVGGSKNIAVDVRIICATNKNLKEEVDKGNFREDLYYRLNVLELHLMPLRFRKKDIIPLFKTFIKKQCAMEDKNLCWSDDKIFEPLLRYNWYGNARELSNFAGYLVACCEKTELDESFILEMLKSKNMGKDNEINIKLSYNLKDIEKEVFDALLDRCNGDKEKLCDEFNISKTTLWRKLNNM